MASKRLSPNDVRAALFTRWRANWRDWLAGEGTWPYSVPLGTPTEAEVTADTSGIRRWVEQWRASDGLAQVSWEERAFKVLGRQSFPARASWADAAAVAQALGETTQFERAVARYAKLKERYTSARALHKHFDTLANYDDTDFAKLERLLGWLVCNPQSGLYLRQLPVEGLDTKWVEPRRGLITEFLRDILGRPESDFYALTGLVREPVRLRIRLLCPELARSVGGLVDIEAPLGELATLPLSPRAVLGVENLETGIALSRMPGVVAFMKLGHGVEQFTRLPWARGRPLVYWGDIDTHGFFILARLRALAPQTRSVLMDEETLLHHRERWGHEPSPHTVAALPQLTPEERSVFNGLRSARWAENLRLEQERIAWAYAMQRLEVALRH